MAAELKQPDTTLGNIGSILQAIPGLAEATGGKTSTSSTSISPQGLNYLLQQLLSSTNGLASVAGGQNSAGLYNSTVQTQMVNDLLARSAGEVQSKTATTTNQIQPTINLGQTLLQGAAGVIGSKILSKGVDTLGSSVADALGLTGGNSATSGAAGALSSATPFTATTGVGQAGSFAVPVANAATGAGAGVSAGGAAGTGAVTATGTGAMDAATAAGIGAATAGTAGAVGAATAGGLAAGGATLGGLGGAIAGDVAASTAGIAAGAGIGAGAAGAADAGLSLAELAPAALAWVVCTELAVQGELDVKVYNKAKPDFLARIRTKPSAVRGYHYWAVRYTRIMRRRDWIGRLAVHTIKPLAIGRAKHIAGKWNICGWITFNILEPICSFLGNTIARKPQNWKSLYAHKEK